MPQLRFTEDTLVQQTTADYLHDKLGWETAYAYDVETFGQAGTLGRMSKQEVVLTLYLRRSLEELNPDLPEDAYTEAIRQIVDPGVSQSLEATNRDKYALLKDGVKVTFRDAADKRVTKRLDVFNFNEPEKNHFLAVRELWVHGSLYHRRPDIVGFVNGIPLLFIEAKNIYKDLRTAYDKNFSDYKDTVPHLFHHNAFIVFGNGHTAKIGSITSGYKHFREWKRLSEDEPGAVDMETLLKGVCDKSNFMDLFENFILFDTSSGKTVKIISQNQQFLGVNRALEAVKDRKNRKGRLGVFWHTQGSGKSYSMVFLAQKIFRKLGREYTFLVCTDRDDLDTQIYKTFAGCGLADNDKDPCRAKNGEHLIQLLGQHKACIFTLIQKFNKRVNPGESVTKRDDLIVFSDEAHRTQYGDLALNMRASLPNAGYMGFTGTPLFRDDQITKQIFGDYVSTYPFDRAAKDGATVPLFYDTRGDKLGVSVSDLNEQVIAKLEDLETEDINVRARLEKEIKREYHVITADKRLNQIARDFVQHYSNAWESGKAMLVCIDKITCGRMYELTIKYWAERIKALETELPKIEDEQEAVLRSRQINWMKETRTALVVSEEQGEVEKFRQWGLDIIPHRKLMKEGIELPPELQARPEFQNRQRLDLDDAFKEPDHPFRIAIVCAMWLTGFDVPSLSHLYLDKPLKAHTLMQAIARANRVYEEKQNGLIVDYCGILKYLRRALATFTGVTTGGGTLPEGTEEEPAKPEEEMLEDLKEAIDLIRAFLSDHDASLDDIIEKTSFERNKAIIDAKEAANDSEESRKRFEVMSREVFAKFKACINVEGVYDHRHERDAINVVYKSLQDDRDQADITDIIRQLHEVVDEAIDTAPARATEDSQPFDISRIDFDRLRHEFERLPAKHTTVQNLIEAVNKRLQRLLEQNPLRTDYQKHYEEIVAEYNKEKDRLTVEQTFEALFKLAQGLSEEETRAVREGLDEESLAFFDLLMKPEMSAADIKRVKKVAVDLLAKLKAEKLKIDQWREKESTRDDVRVTIRDFLYGDGSGLPEEVYTEDEVNDKAEAVFRHVFRAYPYLPSPYYAAAS